MRQMIHTPRMTILRVRFKKGVVSPAHQHVHEQVTMLASGNMRFNLAGEKIDLHGDLLPNSIEYATRRRSFGRLGLDRCLYTSPR